MSMLKTICFSAFVSHFYAMSVVLEDGTIDEGISNNVTRLFDECFHAASIKERNLQLFKS